jgi:CheY-like chemotaxis protein
MTIKLEDFNLLIVDDDESLRNTLCDFFTDEGAKVFSASNGEDALQISLVEKIDLILSDVKMPVMDGLELLKSLTDSDQKIPLIWLMTGQADLHEEGALALGAEGLLNKPFSLLNVLEKITSSLEKRTLTHPS